MSSQAMTDPSPHGRDVPRTIAAPPGAPCVEILEDEIGKGEHLGHRPNQPSKQSTIY